MGLQGLLQDSFTFLFLFYNIYKLIIKVPTENKAVQEIRSAFSFGNCPFYNMNESLNQPFQGLSFFWYVQIPHMHIAVELKASRNSLFHFWFLYYNNSSNISCEFYSFIVCSESTYFNITH
jgi:hypothetical protein